MCKISKEIRELLEEIGENKGSCGVCRRSLWVCDSIGKTCAGRKARLILNRKKVKK